MRYLFGFLKPECKNVDTTSCDDYHREVVSSIVHTVGQILLYYYSGPFRTGA